MPLRRFFAAALVSCLAVPVARATPPASACSSLDAPNHTVGVSDAARGSGPLRVFAIQYRQDASYVQTYEKYAAKMDCLMQEYVAPGLAPSDPSDAGKTNLVVFNEDIGLATLATGSRGAVARALAASPIPLDTPALYDSTGAPVGAAAALGSVAAGYARQLAAYRLRFPDEDPRKAIITAATDTFVRGFMTTFSRLARDYHVYVVASNNQAHFHYSTEQADIAAFADPDLLPNVKGVWVASSDKAWNSAFLFAPYDVRPPETTIEYDPRTNLLYENQKTPLTDIEKQFLALDEGDMSPSNTGPVSLPEVPQFKLGFAISLPAFEYGTEYGLPLPSGADPCAAPSTWMRCLDARGVNTVIQPEANPGPWAHYGADGGNWQALTWGASTLRAVTDPTVSFRYLVCPHMVGNLLDLPFDGQTAIMKRGLTGPGRHYVGAGEFVPGTDSAWAEPYAGNHSEFLALAPWVMPDTDRSTLQARSVAMEGGSLSPYQNGYLETAVLADLDAP